VPTDWTAQPVGQPQRDQHATISRRSDVMIELLGFRSGFGMLGVIAWSRPW
jgi:hypothetical protein